MTRANIIQVMGLIMLYTSEKNNFRGDKGILSRHEKEGNTKMAIANNTETKIIYKPIAL